ncbi:thioredoxin family protein [Myxococcota bacterium]|nr:thioredoxin family protein [Myxococcota bacterium]MBU1380919.1 thioredoxin family protein [Myxococcota bacterium]MBU1496238.1 thioredoxin family protein [Myxococcota bacterium]
MKVFSIVSLAVFSLLFISCSEGDEVESGYKAGETNTVDVAWPGDSGEENYEIPECGPDTYPCPPYGTRRFQVLPDFPFIPVGYFAEDIAGPDGTAWMHDIHQLKAEGKKLLMLTVSAGWCSVCAYQLPNLDNVAEEYADEVVFLLVAQQDDDGYTADIDFAEDYQSRYNADMANVFTTNDFNFNFYNIMNVKAFPFNCFIDLNTMEILSYESGLTSLAAYRTAIESGLSKVEK